MRPLPAPTRNPLRFLVVVVAVDIILAAVLKLDRAVDLVAGQRDWQDWLGALSLPYLAVLIYAVVLVARDRARMRSTLRRRDRALAAHAETTNDWLWETSPELVITYCSRQVQELLGYAPQDVIGRNAHDLMVASTARRSREALASGLADQGWHDVRSEWLHAEGHVVALRHSGAPIVDDDATLLGYRGSGAPADRAQEDAWSLQRLHERVSSVINETRLNMALQPIINVHTGRLVGVEALARFTDGGAPDIWFENAGKVGLRPELEMLAVECAIARLPELPGDVTMSINVCPEVVLDPRLSAMLLDSDLELSRIMIEITEHIRIEEYGQVEATLQVLREAGASLAVDDTGAGYASLSHVLRLRPDNIKLDRSITAGVDSDRARRTLITALVLLAIDIGATVTAEGIETAAELEAVATLGVDHGQGYLVGRPTVDITAWPASLLNSPR